MEAPSNFAEAQANFEASLPGYTRRPAQMALAENVEKVTHAPAGDKKHGLFQASTGTGKSFALTVPAILSGRRAVVATSTKALQTQYATGDLPFLQEHLGVEFDWAVIKGRSNYPCWVKAEEIGSPTAGQREVIRRMEELKKPARPKDDVVIDREDFPEMTEQEWMPFSMSAGECPGASSCPFADNCFAERAKAKAADADIVITNTAYLMRDLLLRGQTGGNVALLGDFGLLIIDEAHNLPDAATRALEDTIGEGTFARLGRDMGGYLMAQGADEAVAEKIEQAAADLWNTLQMRYADFVLKSENKTDPMPLTVHTLINEFGPAFRTLYQAIETTRDEIKATPAFEDHAKVVRQRLMRRSADWLARIRSYTTDEPEKTLRWAEQETKVIRGEKRTRVYLRSAPISVAPFLRSAMFDKVSTILSSATLTAGTKSVNGMRVPDFDYIADTVGLNRGEAICFDAGTPFDYKRQAKLFIPDKTAPEPDRKNMAAWRAYSQQVTHHLITKSGGGALLLFTSGSALKDSYEALAGQLQRDGLTVLRQGDAPTSELVRRFKADGNAVLFGLKTFMEGIDIQGMALRLVVLDKLPFAVPSDLLYQARCEAIERRYNDRWASFNRLTIPSMIVVLTQAFGRLIRHRDDLGLVAILDARLQTKRYGQTIIDALPPASRTDSLVEAAAFLASLPPADGLPF